MNFQVSNSPCFRQCPSPATYCLPISGTATKPEAWNHAHAAKKASALVNCIQHCRKRKARRQRKLRHDLCLMQQDRTTPFLLRRQRQRRKKARRGAHMCDLGHKRIVRVGVGEQRADRQQHLRRKSTSDLVVGIHNVHPVDAAAWISTKTCESSCSCRKQLGNTLL